MSFHDAHQNRRFVFNANPRFEIVRAANAAKATLSGYALVWNVLSKDRGGYQVRLKPGSAKFQTPTIALFQHDVRIPLGNTANGSLRIATDNVGARVEIDLPNTSWGRDVEALVSDKYVQGMSFNMATAPSGRSIREGTTEIFEADSFEVDEVTVCINPAFVESSIGIKIVDPAHSLGTQRRELQRLQLNQLRLSGV